MTTRDVSTTDSPARGRVRRHLDPGKVHEFLNELFGDDLHAKRVLSLANAVTGVVHAAAASIHAIGHGLAAVRGIEPRHAVKQIDRLLSNAKVGVDDLLGDWARFVLADRKEAVVALDWTEFDKDDQATIAAHLITSHGRATPLAWKTVSKPTLEGKRNAYEDELVGTLDRSAPAGVRLTFLADRGFADQKFYSALAEANLGFVIRFRECIVVEDTTGVTKPASEWVPPNGRARLILNARVTRDRNPVGAVVCVKKKGMKEAWCLATNRTDLTAQQLVALYGKRFTIEESFRDAKNLHFGLGLSATHIGRPDRRDRLLLLLAIAQALLTLLGAAGERIGIDRYLKTNTSKTRTYSLFRQGCYWYSAIPAMKQDRFEKLMNAFGELVCQHAVFVNTFGIL